MKFFRNHKTLTGVIAGILSWVAVAFAQTQFTEVNDLLFRSQSPQVRYSGTLSFRTLAGTSVANINQTGQMATRRPAYVTTAATQTLTTADCGAVIVGNATSSTQVFTLPAIGTTGCMFTFIAGHADTEIQFKTPTAVTCVFTHFAAVGADADTAIVTDASCEGGIKNTAGSNAIGDSITIISDGTRWLGVGIASGIWATV